jgi:hypothetical protein
MKEPFEVGWLGGASERHFRKIRPAIRELPWGTLDPSRYPPRLVERARKMWTEMAYTEYATAARFAETLQAMLAAKAPLDLIGMAGDFVADEACHAELACRVVAELGGATPLSIDYGSLTTKVDAKLTPFQRANGIMLRLSCVAEAFSAHMAIGLVRSAAHPLTRSVYELIARDESRHGRIGGLYMEWACGEMDDDERVRLARLALETLRGFAGFWQRPPGGARDGITRDGYRVTHVNELGWMETNAFIARARRAVRVAVVAPLARVGIELDSSEVEALLA